METSPRNESVICRQTGDRELELLTFPVESVESLGKTSANKVYFVKFRNDGHCIAKPSEGEDIFWGYEQGSLFKRERAAFLVDKALGFGLVPPTVIREIDGKISSVQNFVSDAITPGEYGNDLFINRVYRNRELRRQIQIMYIFDYLIFNRDRHCFNLLFSNDKVYAIDNGLSFRDTFVSPFTVQNVDTYNGGYSRQTRDIIFKSIHDFIEDRTAMDKLERELNQLLGADDARAFNNRLFYVYRLLKNGHTLPKNHPPYNPIIQ